MTVWEDSEGALGQNCPSCGSIMEGEALLIKPPRYRYVCPHGCNQTDRRCRTCSYWRDGVREKVHCYRFPPTVRGEGDHLNYRPKTDAYDTCGEWRA